MRWRIISVAPCLFKLKEFFLNFFMCGLLLLTFEPLFFGCCLFFCLHTILLCYSLPRITQADLVILFCRDLITVTVPPVVSSVPPIRITEIFLQTVVEHGQTRTLALPGHALTLLVRVS